MISDSTTTKRQKERAATDLRALGFYLPEWYIEGANSSDIRRLVGQALAARQRYDTELRTAGVPQRDIHLRNHYSPVGEPVTSCDDKDCQKIAKVILAAEEPKKRDRNRTRGGLRPVGIPYREQTDTEAEIEAATWD